MYYIWENQREKGEAFIYGGWPRDKVESSFTQGAKIAEQIPDDIEITLNEQSQGEITDNVLISGPVRVFSKRLLTLLVDNGVNNIDAYPCKIRNLITGEVLDDFYLVNVIGKVACVDIDKSDVDLVDEDDRDIISWGYLTLDENLIGGNKFFVLAEMPGQIVLSEEIVDVLKKEKITGVTFVPQGDSAYKPKQFPEDM